MLMKRIPIKCTAGVYSQIKASHTILPFAIRCLISILHVLYEYLQSSPLLLLLYIALAIKPLPNLPAIRMKTIQYHKQQLMK